ncbi:NUDIX hydrolase [Nocardioides caldifontis]|uniref:NUDIX hydrolase n=1 Tax=Nocardioides caldifontis TaxID=2588938 RepID=UPI001939BC6E|nr:NUDIX hydrolase [Nocardioides caldifontis]
MAELNRYPRPNVAVDLALMTVLPAEGRTAVGRLGILLQPVDDAWALPGRFLRPQQTMEDAVADVLGIKVGLRITPSRLTLLGVFDDPARDPRAWTMSLAHALALPADELESAQGELVGVDLQGRPRPKRPLLYDHADIVSAAVAAIRARYERRPDPDGLLAGPFTLAELRAVHEAVLGEPLLRDTFNRRMTPHLSPVLERDGSPAVRSSGGRPAQLYLTRQQRQLSDDERRRLLLPRDQRPRGRTRGN